jgi:hypothetical protein
MSPMHTTVSWKGTSPNRLNPKESGTNRSFIETWTSQSQSYITTDGQSASLSWCQAPIWDTRPIFPFFSLIIFRQLRVCWCGAPSLTRSRVSSFHFLLGLASRIFLGSESHGTHEHIILSLFLRLHKPGGPGSSIYFYQDQDSAVIPPGTEVSVFLLKTSQHGRHRKHQSSLLYPLVAVETSRLQRLRVSRSLPSRGLCHKILSATFSKSNPKLNTSYDRAG